MAASEQSESNLALLQMSIELREPNPVVRFVVRGLVSAKEGSRALLELYAEHPRAPYYDRLFDLAGYKTGLDPENLARVASAYRALNTDPSFPCRTAIVTLDPNFGLWARSMDFQFQGRRHLTFTSLEEAAAWLAVPLSERRS